MKKYRVKCKICNTTTISNVYPKSCYRCGNKFKPLTFIEDLMIRLRR